MGKDDEQTGDSRSDADNRKASLVLSALALTPDSALEVFRQRRAADPALDVAHLRRARDILDAVHHAISACEPDRWSRIAQAWRLLGRDAAAPAAAPEPEAPAPAATTEEPSVVAAPPAPAAAAPHAPVASPPLLLDAAPGAAACPPSAATSPWAASKPDAGPTPAVLPPAVRPPPGRSRPSVPQPPPPVRRSPAPPGYADPALEPTAAIDVEALNQVELDEDDARTLTADGPAVADGVLPFRKSAGKPPPAPLPIEPPGEALGKTMAMGEMSPLALPALPFDKALREDGDTTAAIPEGATPAADADAVATAPTERIKPGAHPATTAPAVPAVMPPHLTALAVEHYAALCAECASHPQRLEQIHQRYRIASASERAALDAHWRERLASDEQLGRQFRWHYARYEQWARQQP